MTGARLYSERVKNMIFNILSTLVLVAVVWQTGPHTRARLQNGVYSSDACACAQISWVGLMLLELANQNSVHVRGRIFNLWQLHVQHLVCK